MGDQKLLIVGLGLIGKQRLDACLDFGIAPKNIWVYDTNVERISHLNDDVHANLNFVENAINIPKIKFDRAIVSVPHDISAKLASSLLDTGAHVLLEKPLGRNLTEARELAGHINSKNLSIGFNYRFMPGVIRLKKALDNGALGEISTLQMELGHGGGPKDMGTWKLDPVRAGGGVLLDPGIHLIDLLVYLFGAEAADTRIVGKTEWRGFWNTGIEESSNLIGYVGTIPFSIKLSIVAWRTRFKIEIIGTEKYIEIDGRGRSDGPQTITEGSKWGWLTSTSQRSSEMFTQLTETDTSLREETSAWLMGSKSVCSIDQALQGMMIYAEVMESQNEN
jgi:1,5-anhydro-D-fructose reductase (1,5-anhydro-D-mannitol-forming)